LLALFARSFKKKRKSYDLPRLVPVLNKKTADNAQTRGGFLLLFRFGGRLLLPAGLGAALARPAFLCAGKE